MGNPDKNHSKRSGHDLPSGHPNRGSLMPTNGDTLKGALQSTPLRGDTERIGASAQSVPRQAVTPNPYSGGGSMTAINPVRAYKAPRSGPVEGARRTRIGGGTA